MSTHRLDAFRLVQLRQQLTPRGHERIELLLRSLALLGEFLKLDLETSAGGRMRESNQTHAL